MARSPVIEDVVRPMYLTLGRQVANFAPETLGSAIPRVDGISYYWFPRRYEVKAHRENWRLWVNLTGTRIILDESIPFVSAVFIDVPGKGGVSGIKHFARMHIAFECLPGDLRIKTKV